MCDLKCPCQLVGQQLVPTPKAIILEVLSSYRRKWMSDRNLAEEIADSLMSAALRTNSCIVVGEGLNLMFKEKPAERQE